MIYKFWFFLQATIISMRSWNHSLNNMFNFLLEFILKFYIIYIRYFINITESTTDTILFHYHTILICLMYNLNREDKDLLHRITLLLRWLLKQHFSIPSATSSWCHKNFINPNYFSGTLVSCNLLRGAVSNDRLSLYTHGVVGQTTWFNIAAILDHLLTDFTAALDLSTPLFIRLRLSSLVYQTNWF